jgi:hypothetical protein
MKMECTLATLHAFIACFSWSNLYVDGGLQFQDAGDARLEWVTRTNHAGNAIETVTALESVDEPLNPYGRFALGYQIDFKSVTLSLEASHLSSFQTDTDRGINAIAIKARWYPFRH